MMIEHKSGFATSILLLAIAGCSEVPPAPREESAGETAALKARIEGLGEGPRNALFLRAIRDARQSCQGVAGSAYNGIHFGRPAWVARCMDGRDWMIMLDRDGRALVARREEKPADGK
jgi:hypothetical protein